MTTDAPVPRQIFRYESAAWDLPLAPGVAPEDADDAARIVQRAYFARGEGGFYTQITRVVANLDVPTHSHDHAEVFVVLEGSCSFDGEPMTRFDATVVEANEPYGFTAGPEGVSFLVVRRGAATATLGASE